MGTDIHLGVERRTGSEWLPVDRADVFPIVDFEDLYSDPKDYDKINAYWDINPEARDYDTFALLAGVRNGVGFAGIKRCDPVTPCFADRGVPKDTSFPLKNDCWLGGDHSFTFFTYKEALEKVPWTKETVMYGKVPLDHYREWKTGSRTYPRTWCGDGSMEIISEEQAMVRITDGEVPEREDDRPYGLYTGPYVDAQWTMRPTADVPFRRWLMSEQMQRLAAEHGAENVRILVSFDS